MVIIQQWLRTIQLLSVVARLCLCVFYNARLQCIHAAVYGARPHIAIAARAPVLWTHSGCSLLVLAAAGTI